jgi:hypothetical protein
VYGFAAVDLHSRVGDRRIPRVLGWSPETRLEIREDRGLTMVVADPRAVFRVTGQGFVQLPAVVRHWCRLAAGDRVFLVADPAVGRLAVYPPAALDAMVAAAHTVVRGGEAP